MRKMGLLVGLCFAALAGARAQIEVEVALDQDQFLPNEPVLAAVRVTNRSGQTLRLGEAADWLQISVEGKEGFLVTRLDDVPVVGAFTLGSSKVATKRVNLTPYFDLSRPGRYAITATVRIKDWDKEFQNK